jgi:hypothetical protein
MANVNIELSAQEIERTFKSGEAYQWAKNVYAKNVLRDKDIELSEEEEAFSQVVNGMVNDAWKYGKTEARESIAQIVVDIIEPVVFDVPNEVLSQFLTDKGSYGEFDMVRIRKSPKNTLVARQVANRTGNVDKSYLDITEGNTMETVLQIETEIPMSNLRRDGATGVATLAMYAIEAFDKEKFKAILAYVDKLVTGGSQVFGVTGSWTAGAAQSLTDYTYDNAVTGKEPLVVGLSNRLREMCRAVGADFYSNTMKDALNNLSLLQVLNGCKLVPILKGKKDGEGNTLLPENRVFGFSGTIGEMYTKGQMITRTSEEMNGEKINFKFTGVEFGICITDTQYISKITIS